MNSSSSFEKSYIIPFMSFILRDPFFNGFEDYVSNSWPFSSGRPSPFAVEDKKDESLSSPKRIRRDVITPFSGFGRMDMQETENHYELSADIPGMEKGDIKITTDNNMLTIEGERKNERHVDDNDNKFHFTERHFGSFHREISLPVNANPDHINAVYNNGVLKVSIPKVKKELSRKSVEIK